MEETAARTDRVLVIGAPRSGTTWVGRALGRTPGAVYVHEPDNHRHTLEALRCKRGLGAFPALAPGARSAAWEALWDAAFDARDAPDSRRRALALKLLGDAGVADKDRVVDGHAPAVRLRLAAAVAPAPPRRRGGARPAAVVVKSVQAQLAAAWLAERYGARLLVVRRDPLNILASWLELDFDELGGIPSGALAARVSRWGVEPPRSNASQLARIAWRIGFLCAELEELRSTDATTVATLHEWLCEDPAAHMRRVALDLGLGWGAEADAFVRDSNSPGYSYDTHRIASEQPGRWRERLTPEQVEEGREVLRRFPLDDLLAEVAERTPERS